MEMWVNKKMMNDNRDEGADQQRDDTTTGSLAMVTPSTFLLGTPSHLTV